MGNIAQQNGSECGSPSPVRLGSAKICGDRWPNHHNCEFPHVCGLPHGYTGNHVCGVVDQFVRCIVEWPNNVLTVSGERQKGQTT